MARLAFATLAALAAAAAAAADVAAGGGAEAGSRAADRTACAAPRPWPALQALDDDLWWLPSAVGETDAGNRGHVSNLIVAVHEGRLWLVGSGPSPAFGRALRCALHDRWPALPIVLISPWPHPENVMGAAGLEPDQHWAHAEVALQMAQRCRNCVERLRARLGAAAADLGAGDPTRLPGSRVDGDSGRLGPFRWWRLRRADDVTVTVWAHDGARIAFAPGLLWDGRAPDGRDAELRQLAESTAALAGLRGLPQPLRWIGEQGGVQAASAAGAAAAYWRALLAAVGAALDRGELGAQPPALLEGIDAAVTGSPLHALNWQRAWRQEESRWLQRSLR
ncbi:MAG: hypothetical protein HYZ20_18400 [Burkholderiales bacterium]|nr:hypothetical protein [Burkholderiales bacterium]